MFEDCFLVLQRFHSNGQWFSAAVLAEKWHPSHGLQEVESKPYIQNKSEHRDDSVPTSHQNLH